MVRRFRNAPCRPPYVLGKRRKRRDMQIQQALFGGSPGAYVYYICVYKKDYITKLKKKDLTTS